MNLRIWTVVLWTVASLLLNAVPAPAQDISPAAEDLICRASSAEARPLAQGYYGVGHDKWHEYYKGMHNLNKTSCCSAATDGECRPTTSKIIDGQRWALLDGIWVQIQPYQYTQEYQYSFSDTAHICAAGANVYCFIPEGEQY